jgi:hypothetical protein
MAEKITNDADTEDGMWLHCLCGNTPDMDGFCPCVADGTIVSPRLGSPWEGALYACAKCGRIIDQDTLNVTGRRDPDGVIEESIQAERDGA